MKYLLTLFLLCSALFAQKTGTINSSGSTCVSAIMDSATTGPSNCVSMQLSTNASGASIVLSGTFTATVQFEVSADNGTTWVAASTASAASAGTFNVNLTAYTHLRARCSSYGSGTITVTIQVATGIGGVIGITGGSPVQITNNAAFAGPRPWIDVTSATYGADPTGVADSAAAINSAITACGTAGGGIIYFPPGTYLRNSQILLNQPNCTLYGVNRTAILRKNYNSTSGYPGASGSILISGNNTGIVGLIIDENNSGGKTGAGITDASNNSDVLIQNNKIFNCDNSCVMLTSSSSFTTPGPTRVQLLDNYILPGANTDGNNGAIGLLGTVGQVLIRGNRLDCSLDTNTAGVGCIQAESQGLTTILSGITIDDNYITASTPASNTGWDIQIGPFNAYALTDVIITNNTMEVLSAPSGVGGCVSAEFIPGLVFSNNTCNFNGVTENYTGFEVFADKAVITNNTCNIENAGQADCFNFIALNNSSVIGNVINGGGENGGGANLSAGMIVGGNHSDQAISTLNETGNIVTVVATGTCSAVNLCPWFQPGATINISGATTSGYNISGTILNTGYVRTTGTFTMYNPTSGLASCSGACTTSALINAQQNNNVIANNTFTLPCGGTLAGNRYGILVRPQAAGEQANNNKIHDNTIIGCGTGAAGDFGISLGQTGTSVDDGNVVTNNYFINLATGLNIVAAATNVYVGPQFFKNVTTSMANAGTANLVNSALPTAFGKLVACAAGLEGNIASVTDDTTAAAYNATVVAGGAIHVQARCNGTNWVMQ